MATINIKLPYLRSDPRASVYLDGFLDGVDEGKRVQRLASELNSLSGSTTRARILAIYGMVLATFSGIAQLWVSVWAGMACIALGTLLCSLNDSEARRLQAIHGEADR